MKQTAVEWLDKQIENISIQVFDGFLTFIEFMEEREKLFNQSKELEKQQIIDARLTAPSELITYSKTTYLEEAEKYYNETFKKL